MTPLVTERSFGSRLLAAYKVLHPGKNLTRGPQVWLRRIMSQQTHLKPSKATVSRWVNGTRKPWTEAWQTLDRLEDDARLTLGRQMRELDR